MLQEQLPVPYHFLFLGLSSLHPLPLSILALALYPPYTFCLPVFISLPSCHHVQHLILRLTFHGSRQQCLSSLLFGIPTAQEVDLIQPPCSIHQPCLQHGPINSMLIFISFIIKTFSFIPELIFFFFFYFYSMRVLVLTQSTRNLI